MIRRPPRSTRVRSSAASDVYKRQGVSLGLGCSAGGSGSDCAEEEGGDNMSVVGAARVLRKDLELGPRSPIFLYALVFPILATLLIQLVFGGLFSSEPRLGIIDRGHSKITTSMESMEGIRLTTLEDEAELRRRVRDNSLDAGLILQDGFDKMVRSGQRPELEFFVGGQSLASDRLILAVTTIDLIGQMEVQLTTVGNTTPLPLSSRLIPMIVLLALIMAGVFLTAFSLVEEKEQGTLEAMLVTPTSVTDILVAKSAMGLILSILMAAVTLALNGALGSRPEALLASLFVGALMSAEIGLIYGTAAKDSQSLFTLVKTLNIVIVTPVIFYIFPDWPQWVAKIFPTYWFLDPIYQVALQGADFSAVWKDLAVAVAICHGQVLPD